MDAQRRRLRFKVWPNGTRKTGPVLFHERGILGMMDQESREGFLLPTPTAPSPGTTVVIEAETQGDDCKWRLVG